MQNGIIKGASYTPAIDRTPISRPREFKIKFLVLFLTCVMVISAAAMILPGMIASPDGKIPVVLSEPNNGLRETYYNYSDFFHTTFQDWNWNRSGGVTFEEAGWHESNPTNKFHDRMPTWYLLRKPNYGEMIYRDTYPHIWYYMPNPYSTQTTPDVSVGPVPYAPMRFSLWARNVTDCKTTTDAIFVPDLDGNPARPNGGWINISYYLTYMGNYEFSQIKTAAGFANHWVSWLYGVEARNQFPPASADDGYWCQFMGQMQFSRQAAMSYLGWAGTGDVRDWFQANEENIEQGAWFDDWMAEGSGGGAYDIYTAYDYPNDIRVISLQYDALNSTANTISFRIYTFSWGMDALIVRWLEAANVTKNAFQGWMEDMSLKINISPNMMNLSLEANIMYQLQAWEDDSDSVWSGGWKLENVHMDWCGNTGTHNSYPSPYNLYDPDQTNWLTESRAPWTTHFDQNVSYWVAPLERDLYSDNTYTYNEYINIQLNTDDVIGFRPGQGTSDSDPTYYNTLHANQYWGRMVLGKGSWPYDDIAAAYDPVTKTIHLEGPLDFPIETQPGTSDVLLHGVPAFMFDVSPVSYYTVEVTGPHTTTLADTITITGYNGTGAIMPTWYDGTVVLSDTDPGADPASVSHTWAPGDNGVWSTTITWQTAGVQYVNATDEWFDLDVSGSSGPISVSLIPEFSTLLIPTIGAIAIFLVFRTKRRRKIEE